MAKKQVICDTDVMIDYWNITSKRSSDVRNLIENKIGLDNIVISIITKMELLMGSRNKNEENKIQYKLHRFNTLLINNEICIKAIELLNKYRLSQGLAIPDLFHSCNSQINPIGIVYIQ